MPAPKGSKNAAEYQQQQVAKVVARLMETLSELKTSGVLFQNITNLSKYLARQLNISDVSLRRNNRYRAILDEYLVSQPGAASILTRRQQDLNVLKAKIKTLQIENSNKAQAIKRLEAALLKLNLSVDVGQHAIEASEKRPNNRSKDDFIAVSNLVLALLELLPGVIVDPEKRMIVDQHDLSGNEVVAAEQLAGPFIDWMLSREVERIS